MKRLGAKAWLTEVDLRSQHWQLRIGQEDFHKPCLDRGMATLTGNSKRDPFLLGHLLVVFYSII